MTAIEPPPITIGACHGGPALTLVGDEEQCVVCGAVVPRATNGRGAAFAAACEDFNDAE